MVEEIIVIALGGNAVLKRGQKGSFDEQYENVKTTVSKIADLIVRGYKIVLTHGNGPQVGATLLRHEAAKSIVPPFPLDACGAETQGFIGYMIQQALRNELKTRGIDKYVVTIITRVIVDKHDSAFQHPTKPIGPFYSKEESVKVLQQRPDLVIREDAGRGYRRMVPSPDPKIIAERGAIRALVDSGFVVVACGGGGIPIIEENTQASGCRSCDRQRPSSPTTSDTDRSERSHHSDRRRRRIRQLWNSAARDDQGDNFGSAEQLPARRPVQGRKHGTKGAGRHKVRRERW